jgi:hypothetical protein
VAVTPDVCCTRGVRVTFFCTRWLHARVRVSARAGYVNVHVRVRVHADLSVPIHSRLVSYLFPTDCCAYSVDAAAGARRRPIERMCVILEEVKTQSHQCVTTTAVHVEGTQMKHRLQRIKTVSDQYLAELGQTSAAAAQSDADNSAISSCKLQRNLTDSRMLYLPAAYIYLRFCTL